MRYLDILLLCILTMMSCSERELSYSIVPDEIKQHYDAFYYEAEIRGIYLKEKPVEFIVVDQTKGGGTAQVYTSKKQIAVTKGALKYGHPRDVINVEYVIFHEMGHYVLEKGHDNTLDENGFAASIMHPNKVAYTSGKRSKLREYYLDKLFGSEIISKQFANKE